MITNNENGFVDVYDLKLIVKQPFYIPLPLHRTFFLSCKWVDDEGSISSAYAFSRRFFSNIRIEKIQL